MGVFRGHKRGVWCVAFSPVDLVLATSSGDKTIKLWSLTDFSCLKVRVDLGCGARVGGVWADGDRMLATFSPTARFRWPWCALAVACASQDV